MFASVAWRSLSSASIFSVVSFAFATYNPNEPPASTLASCNTYRLGLKRLDRLDVRAHVVRDGLELAQELLRLVDDGLVAQHRAVVREVDRRRLRGERGVDALGVPVPLAERLEGCDGLCAPCTLRQHATSPHPHSLSARLTLAETERGVDAGEVLRGHE